MRTKILLFLCVTLLSCMGFAQTAVWNPAPNPNSTGLWTEGENWTGTDSIFPNDANVKVVFNVDAARECVLADSVMTNHFVIGDAAGIGESVVRVVKGGSLNTQTHWAGLGWQSPGKLIVEQGGVVNFGEHLWNGWGSDGTVIIDGGTVNVKEMYGTAFEGAAGVGKTYVKNGGILNLNGLHPDKSFPNGSFIDISGGMLTAKTNQVDKINTFITNEKITAYDGNGELTVTYDATTDLTTVVAASVTFMVDLSQVTDLTAGGKVWVSIGNWADYEVMTDDNNDGIYVASIPNTRITEMGYFFAYQKGAAETDKASESLTGKACGDANGYRTLAALPTTILVLPPVLFNSCDVKPAPQPQATTVWTGAANGLWSVAKNWSDGFVPDANKVVFNVPGARECVLNVASSIGQFVLGDGNDGGTLRIAKGGTLTTTQGWSGIAWTHPAKMIIDEGGTLNFAEHAWIGWGADAIMEINGGTVNVAGMYGTAFEGGAGTGSVYVNKGVLNLAQLHPTKSIPDGSVLDISEGTVNITGDHVAEVNAYIDADKIIGYGGNEEVNVELIDGNTKITAGTTGIKEMDNQFAGKVYPNPTRGLLMINNPSNHEFGFAIYTITGKLVSKQNNLQGSNTQVDLSGFSKGIYLININSASKRITHKVVLQ